MLDQANTITKKHYELLEHKKPNVFYFKVLAANATFTTTFHFRKFDSRSEGNFVRYLINHHDYAF